MKGQLFVMVLAATAIGAYAADINSGKTKSVTCAGCHGTTGISAVPMYPNLAGQKSLYMEKQLKAFRDGTRDDPIMAPMAKPLSDDDIADLSKYYESL